MQPCRNSSGCRLPTLQTEPPAHGWSARTLPPQVARTLSFIVQRNWALMALGRGAELRKGIDLALPAARVPDLLVQDAVLKIDEKDYTGAKASLHEALNANPENLPGLAALLRLYAIQKMTPEAIEDIRMYVAKRPRSTVLLGILGNVLAADGKPGDARRAYLQAEAADPNSTIALLALANLDSSEGKFDAARQGFNKLQKIDPRNPQIWMRRGALEANLKNYPEAIECYRKVLELEPRNAFALNNAAYL